MLEEIVITILWSISPFGEAKVGIPYGLLNGVNIYVVFIISFLANVMVFPLMWFFLNKVNKYLLQWRFYKKIAVWIAIRAKSGSGDKIRKYGMLGLAFFVMIPLPGTGVYAGTIATYILRLKTQHAFIANTIGIFISSAIVWGTTVATINGLS